MRRTLLFLALAAGVALFPASLTHAQEATGSPPPAVENSPPPIPPPKPAPDDPKMHKLAVRQFLAFQGGVVDRKQYSDDVNAQLNDELLDGSEKALAALGALQTVNFRGISRTRNVNVYVYRMTCEHGSIDMEFALQPDGKIAVLLFV
ncbi:MAG TPA: hypothetical protein VFO29_09195 [Candidatus Rubrimentiphilum sp.]|nr:hypothetical protein [Candidatus Rubrimentiphilum sp.]